MPKRYSILVVEDDHVLAMNLAAAVEDRGCDVVGPEATVAVALQSLRERSIDAAILDANLLDRNVTPVAMELIERAIPFVIHTGIGLPEELASVFPHVSVIMKPTDPDEVVGHLLDQVRELRGVHGKAASPTRAGSDGSRNQQVEKIASALFDQFGSKAIVLARRQADDASDDVLATWNEIIQNLEKRVIDRDAPSAPGDATGGASEARS